MEYYKNGAVTCFEQEGNLSLEERSSWVAYFVIILFLLPILAGTIVALQEQHPFYSIVMPPLLLLVLLPFWFSLTWRKLISVEKDGDSLLWQRSWFGKLRREHRITVSGYDEVQYGTGLTANGSPGGRLEYVMLINSNPECNFKVHSTYSKNEAEVIANQIANYTGLSLQKVKWDRDPSFISNLPSYCRYIKRMI